MDDVIKRACALLGAEPDRVLSANVDTESGQVFIVIDWGIAGGKKYRLPLSDLPTAASAQPEPALDTSNLLKAELAAELEARGLATDGTKAVLKARLDEAIGN